MLRPPAGRWGRARDDERGAVAVMVAVLAVLILAVGAFAVDLGVQRVSRRDMQALADVVALDLARQLRGGTAAEIEADPRWAQALSESLQRNDRTVGDTPELEVQLGELDPVTGAFREVSGAEIPTAVRVVASTEVDFVFVDGSGGAARSAVAAPQPTACFMLGSYALGLTSGSSGLLNTLVGEALGVRGVGYDGLATSWLSLQDLALELRAGSVDELLSLDRLGVGELYLAVADVLQRRTGDTANAALLEQVRVRLGPLPTVSFADLVALTPGDNAALAARLNVLDLVAGAAFLANGDAFLDVPVSAAVPWLSTDADLRIRIVQRPQVACGPVGVARARTSQLEVKMLHGDILDVPTPLGVEVAVEIARLDLEVGSAEGVLAGVRCAVDVGDPEGITVDVGSSLLDLGLEANVDVDAVVARANLHVGLEAHNRERPGERAELLYPPMSYDMPDSSGGPLSLPLTGVQVGGHLSLFGGPPANLGSLKVDVGRSVVRSIDDLLLTPLSGLLGLSAAGADVYGVPRPSCDTPALRG